MTEPLFQSGICEGIDPSAARTLQGLLAPVRFRSGQQVFTEGQPGDKLYVITSGKVRISKTASDGRRIVLMVAGPTDVVGALSLFDPGPRTTTARTLTEVDAQVMDQAALRSWITECPEISERLLQVLARRVRRTNTMVSDLIFTDVPGRVAKALLRLGRQFGTADGSTLQVDHDLNQSDLAGLVGSSRETVNKALNDFADRGWLRLSSGSVEILRPERLARRAR